VYSQTPRWTAHPQRHELRVHTHHSNHTVAAEKAGFGTLTTRSEFFQFCIFARITARRGEFITF
jgi:hypothetical protein